MEALQDVLDRVNVRCISWKEFSDVLVSYAEHLEDGKGDRTLRNVIKGLSSAIAEHPLSKVEGVE